ncbi:MAG TPA: DUF5677 domain-containing protein, partial [Terriglobales bacterium]|nr:DUF5677 domain-containing protein [Terriglobales bacterium]
MNDESHKSVLDRGFAVEAAKHFKDALGLLNELIDYGTSLIPRAFVSSPRDLKAICVIFVQLRQFIVHLDGVAILGAAGNCSTANLQLRSLLETSHALEWLLTSDTDSKVNHLYVANLRRRRQWDSILIAGTPEATRHADAARRISLSADQAKEIADEVRRLDDLLSRAPFDAVNARFEPHYSRRGYDAPWYVVYGAPSIRKVAEEIGRLNEYSYIYSPFSGTTHGSDMWKSIVVGDQNVEMNAVREPHDIPRIVQLAATLSFRVYRLILRQYREGEEASFNRKYVQEWRARFMKE